ncbi:GP16 [Dione juno nucleopolyhedrovirus]|uniref:GP16 n=1 Tax=Dione juno nucleopolyhedrovirus TaxID=2594175 RepID=A0AAE6H397_9ABAC|nr:GP16 [Dione juno nucleopolyhedrovirus]QDL57020.1 GP16 [Dione juno nucleopolyhedrovirus]
MNFWAAFSACLVGYLLYSGHLDGELQEIKSVLVVAYHGVIDEIESLKTDTFLMLANLHNSTLRIWEAVSKNNKKIANLDEKINGLLSKYEISAPV